ncbi:MAG: hypothetical protein LQ342_004134 [Letrouitia transgressa]|nr:MAG: hypothetical protein LQ342_004134 [Letrouitia transgressa]
MKPLPLLRWSGSVLSPRIRPCCFHHPPFPPLSAQRHQATAAAPEQVELFPDDSVSTKHKRIPSDIRREASLRALPSPPPSHASRSAKLAALHARLSLSPRLPIETLARCLIDSTADPHPDFNNSSLASLGRNLLSYYTAEAILCRYPRLPTAVVFAAMSAYSGPKTLATITREWGVEIVAEPGGEVDMGYLQCRREDSMWITKAEQQKRKNAPETPAVVEDPKALAEGSNRPNAEKQGWRRGVSSMTVYDDEFGDLIHKDKSKNKGGKTTVEDACSKFVHAVVGAVYLHRGRNAAKMFFKEHILSRHLDVGKMFEFRQPTRDLSRLCAREGFESPVARILSETGRLSRHPVFVVGVFSGREKLGEGVGASLDEARTRASVAALKGWYLYSPLNVKVPSEAEGPNAKQWQPVHIDIGEVVV